jgi:hypothetical protein
VKRICEYFSYLNIVVIIPFIVVYGYWIAFLTISDCLVRNVIRA